MRAVVCKVDDLFEWATTSLKKQEKDMEDKRNRYNEAVKCNGIYGVSRDWGLSEDKNNIEVTKNIIRKVSYQKLIGMILTNFEFPNEEYEQDFYSFIESKSK